MLEFMTITIHGFGFGFGRYVTLKNPNWFCQNSHLGWSLSPGHWPIGLAVMNQKKIYCHITVVVLTFLKIVIIIFLLFN